MEISPIARIIESISVVSAVVSPGSTGKVDCALCLGYLIIMNYITRLT